MRASILFAFLAGCGSQVPPVPGVIVACHTQHDACMPEAQVDAIVDAFAAFEDFDVGEPLEVSVYDHGTTWDFHQGHLASAFTPDGGHITTSAPEYLPHELYHALYWRNVGDGDVNHSDAPGPWTHATDVGVRMQLEQLRAAGVLE